MVTLRESQRSGELEDWGMKVQTNVARRTCAGMDKGAGGAAEKKKHSVRWMARKMWRGNGSDVCVSGAEPLSGSMTKWRRSRMEAPGEGARGPEMESSRSTGTQGQGIGSDPRDQLAPT